MIRLYFQLKQKEEDLLRLVFPPGFRIFFLIIVIAILAGLGSYLSEGNNSIPVGPLVVLFICILSGLYDESWYFNRKTGIIERRFGLLFIFRRTVINFKDLEKVEIREITKGSLQTKALDKKKLWEINYTILSLVTKSGEISDIEMVNSRLKKKLQEKAKRIADFCSVPLGKAVGY